MITIKHQTAHYLMSALLLTLFSAGSIADNPTFEKVCASCHTGGFKGWISGAPNIQNKQDWQEIIKRDTPERMREIVMTGSNDHDLKGGCKKCSDQDINSAIDYVLLNIK